ncbi:PAS domain S-box protein [Anabaena cylindrica UHCC 0172]|uniref:PAS domain-containing sensor histidine kinase n=1 Tax=Anabaena cylindrica TaxID=1165 RepID=UPI002B217BEB|nr:PAS domain S-box protein [Anabaena cylindrica]MEA5554241.1 PAS domain S-box protein [Anabaena cylindrica UHCC 0172]
MTSDFITVNKSTYESLQQELVELRKTVANLTQTQFSTPVKYNHEQMDLFMEYTPAAIAIFDRQMRYVLASRRWREDHGLGDKEIIGRSHCEILPNLPQYWQKIHQRCLTSTFEKCEEDSFSRDDGTIEWVKWEIHPWYQKANEISGIIMFTEIITTRKQAEIALADSERRLRDIATNLPGAIFQFTNRNGVWTVNYISDFIWKLAGIKANEMMQNLNSFITLIHPEDINNYIASVIESTENFTPWHYEGRLIKPNGEIRWWQGDSTPTKNEQGEIIFCGVLLDITASHEAEESLKKLNEELEAKIEERTAALHQSEARLHRLADNVPGMMHEFRLSPDGEMSFPYVSSGCREILGLEPEQIQKDESLIFSSAHPDDVNNIKAIMFQSAQTLENYQTEWRITTPSKHQKWVKAIAKPERQPDNGILWYGCLFDITELKQAEAQLQEKEEFLRSIYEGISQVIFVVDVLDNNDFCFAGWNSSGEKLSGISQADIIGKKPEYLHGEVEGAVIRQRYQNCIASGTSISYEELLTIKNEETWWLTTLNPLKDSNGRIYRLVGTTLNITERKQAEEALQASQHFIQRITDSSPNLLYIFDLEEQRNVYTNQAISDFLGYSHQEMEQIDADLISSIIHPEDKEKVIEHWQSFINAQDGEILEIEYRMKNVNSEWCWLYSRDTIFYRQNNGQVKQILGVATNITERKKAEIMLQQQTQNLEKTLLDLKQTQIKLIHSEKMSSLGNMVAGIAHEINNPVNFIHGNLSPANEYVTDLLNLVELYQKHFPEVPEEIQEKIKNIELEFIKLDIIKILNSMSVGTDRIREIVLSLRNFSRLDESEIKAVNIHEGIDSTLMILQNRLKSKPNYSEIDIIKNYGNLPLIQCYPGQLNQVFMNILSNAIDALENANLVNKKREIHIITEKINNYRLAIRIFDNGLGIPAEIIPKLFDPFFTTKDVGKGTGLGLSISYQIIVDKHKGNLSCYSTLGKGTEFVIEIPMNLGLTH